MSSERPLQQRIVAQAVELTVRDGWSSVTMGRLADAVGVSRQTVYNEIGSKPALAEAMVARELEQFLAAVRRAFDAHPDDLVEAVRAAARGVLQLARDNALLQAIASASHGAASDLLPLLTTHSGSLLVAAEDVVRERVAAYAVPLDGAQAAVVVDAVVRLVLSHVTQPSATPERTADDLAWLVSRLLG
ncbi:MAG: TetR family transcriptional regulator [Actinomycetes bacterium]